MAKEGERLEERMRGLAALSAIAEAISGSLDLDETLDKALEKVMEFLGVEAGAIYLFAEGKGQGKLVAHRGLSEEFVQWANTTQLDQRTIKRLTKAAKNRRPLLVIEEVFKQRELLKDIQAAIAREKAHSYLPILLRFGEDLLGVMVVASRQPREFTPEEIDFSVAIGRQIGVAIENARLYQEVQSKRDKLAAILSGMEDGVDVVGKDYIVKFQNRLLLERFGDLTGQLCYKGYMGLEQPCGFCPAVKAIETGKPHRVESVGKDGRDYELISMPLRNPDGTVDAIEVVRDITERKRAEEEIRQRSEQLAALNEIAMTVTSTLDLQEVLHAIQWKVMELLGEIYSPYFFLLHDEGQTFRLALTRLQEQGLRRVEKSIGTNLEERSFPLSTLNPALREALLVGKPYLTNDLSGLSELEISRKLIKDVQRELEIKWVVGLPLWVKGKLVGIMLLGSPKETLPEEEIQLLSAIASQAAIAIENARLYEQTDEKLRNRVAELMALNAITQSLTRSLELDEILKSIVTRVAQVMQARICTIRLVEGNELTIGAALGYRDESSRQHTVKIDERLARIVQDQQPLLVEDLWEAEDIPLSRRERAKHEGVQAFLGVPMISREKTIGILSIYREEPHRFREEEVRLLSTVANQTAVAIERAMLHEKVREHAEELAQLVQERTKELQAMYSELLQSAKLAALGQLVAGVAHELNNPLGAISGYLELLQEEIELGPRDMEYVERIERRIQQATRIVGELRSLGMPSEPVWQVVDINDILEETLTLVERRPSLHQIRVQRDMTPDLPLMYVDPDRLQQVFINLITNARQAMEEGGTLRIASRESRNGEWVEIIFADTGVGIAKDHLNKIFDPFFTTRSPGEGMGLGLSLSHRHIKDHGGAIDVWSEKGKGTVFRVALPPSGAKRCWEIIDCDKKERCKAVRENADYRCWSVMEDMSLCERCEVYRRKALPPLDGSLLPQ